MLTCRIHEKIFSRIIVSIISQYFLNCKHKINKDYVFKFIMSFAETDKKEATEKLKELANSCSDINDIFFDFISYDYKYIDVPEKYSYNESKIVISGKFYELYKNFFKFLESEKELEYMINSSNDGRFPEENRKFIDKERKFVESELDKFVLDVLLDKKYRESHELESRIKETLDSIYRPLNKYKIIIPINFFNTEATHIFEIEDSVISRLDSDNLKKDALASNTIFESFFKTFDKFENNYCITIYEEGNNISSVIKRARKKASDHLDFLRLYFFETSYRTFAAKFFSISDTAFIYMDGKFIGPSYNRDEKLPLIQTLDSECIDKINKCLAELDKLSQIKNPKSEKRIRRTIHWLGKAITEIDLDVSLILYCTALESLLIPESDGRKGELLALRVALIEKQEYNGILNPYLMFNIYETRSKVVHGSEHEISREKFIHDIELFVSRIFYPFIKFAVKNSQMKPAKLMKTLENFEDILEVFFHLYFHSSDYDNSEMLINYILSEKLLRVGETSGKEYVKISKRGIERKKETPSEILDRFSNAAKSKKSTVRSSAVFTMGFLKEPLSVNLLSNILLNDEDVQVRKYAALSLGNIMDKESSSLEPLIRTLTDENEIIREAAVTALGWTRNSISTKALIESLKDKKAKVRAASAISLSLIQDQSAFEPLLEALDDNNYEVISSVSIALGRFKDRRAIEKLNITRNKKIYGTLRAIDWALDELNK